MRSLITTIIISALTLSAALPAMSADEDQQKKIKFYCASWEHMDDELYFASKAKKKKPEYHPISLSVMLRSPLYETKASRQIAFYKRGPVSPEGEPTYQVVATGTVPLNCSRVTFIFLKSEPNKIRVKAIADDKHHSPFGSYQFYNMTKLTIKGALANERFIIKPGKTKMVTINKKKGTHLPFATFTEINGKKRWLQRNTWTYNPDKHLKIFILAKSDKHGRVQVSSKSLLAFKPPAS